MSVILICDTQNLVCRPFWPWEAEDMGGKRLENVMQYFTKDNWIKRLEAHLSAIDKRSTKLASKNEDFRKTRDEVSYIRAELQASFRHIDEAQKSLEKADCKASNKRLLQKKDTIITKLKDLSVKNIQCREKINNYLEKHSSTL